MYQITFINGKTVKTKTLDKAYLYHCGKFLMDIISHDGEPKVGVYENISLIVKELTDSDQKEKAVKITTDLKKAQELVDKTAVVIKKGN